MKRLFLLLAACAHNQEPQITVPVTVAPPRAPVVVETPPAAAEPPSSLPASIPSPAVVACSFKAKAWSDHPDTLRFKAGAPPFVSVGTIDRAHVEVPVGAAALGVTVEIVVKASGVRATSEAELLVRASDVERCPAPK
jgi:hypothetical protein